MAGFGHVIWTFHLRRRTSSQLDWGHYITTAVGVPHRGPAGMTHHHTRVSGVAHHCRVMGVVPRRSKLAGVVPHYHNVVGMSPSVRLSRSCLDGLPILTLITLQAYTSLWGDITQQFTSHPSPVVLSHAVAAIRYLMDTTSLSTTNNMKILELEDKLATSLHDLYMMPSQIVTSSRLHHTTRRIICHASS